MNHNTKLVEQVLAQQQLLLVEIDLQEPRQLTLKLGTDHLGQK